MKSRKWVILAVIVLLLLAAGLIVLINSFRYNSVYLPYFHEQLDKTERDYLDNKAYFDICASSMKDKYQLYASSGSEFNQKQKVQYGEMRFNYYGLLLKPNNGGSYKNDSTYSISSDDSMFIHTDSASGSFEAFAHILNDLGYSTIYYCMLEDGRYYLYFCKDGILKKPVLSISDYNDPENAVNYGILYASDGKPVPQEVRTYFFEDDKELSPGWHFAYGT